MLVKHSRSI